MYVYCRICKQTTSHCIANGGIVGDYNSEKHDTCMICGLNKAGQIKKLESQKQISFGDIEMRDKDGI